MRLYSYCKDQITFKTKPTLEFYLKLKYNYEQNISKKCIPGWCESGDPGCCHEPNGQNRWDSENWIYRALSVFHNQCTVCCLIPG